MPTPGPTHTELSALELHPGDRALLEVELQDWPASDVTNISVSDKRSKQRFWVPTKLLSAIPTPDWCQRMAAWWRGRKTAG